MYLLPSQVTAYGFVDTAAGVQTSRTIMLAELRLLLAACSPDSDLEAYRSAVIDDNLLGKRTLSTRLASFRRLRELYTLDSSVVVFRALRDLWTVEHPSQPLLAMLCAAARDAILRVSAETILSTPVGDPVTKEMLEAAVQSEFPDRYSLGVRARIGRNLASSWEQSGHLTRQVAQGSRPGCLPTSRRRVCALPRSSLWRTGRTALQDALVPTARHAGARAPAAGDRRLAQRLDRLPARWGRHRDHISLSRAKGGG